MATYQGARFIDEQLTSIASGTRMPDEMVICDDGSTDDTVERIEAFVATAPFPVRVIRHEHNQGTLVAFGDAIAACHHEIIVLSDQDDIWYPDRIATLVDEFGRNPSAQLAFSEADLINPDGKRIGTFWPMVGVTSQHIRLMLSQPFGLLVARPMVGGCTMAMRSTFRDVLLPMPTIAHGQFGPFVHDRWLSLALASLGPYALVERPLLEYRLHNRSVSQADGCDASSLRICGSGARCLCRVPYNASASKWIAATLSNWVAAWMRAESVLLNGPKSMQPSRTSRSVSICHPHGSSEPSTSWPNGEPAGTRPMRSVRPPRLAISSAVRRRVGLRSGDERYHK